MTDIAQMVEQKIEKNKGGRPRKDGRPPGSVPKPSAPTPTDYAVLSETLDGLSDVGHFLLVAKYPQFHPSDADTLNRLRVGRARSLRRMGEKYLQSIAPYSVEIDFGIQWGGFLIAAKMPKEFLQPIDTSGAFPKEARAGVDPNEKIAFFGKSSVEFPASPPPPAVEVPVPDNGKSSAEIIKEDSKKEVDVTEASK